MTYSPVLIVHICGGVIGVLSGSMALVVRKGSRLHRRAGDVFVISMLIMAAAGAYVAFTKSQPTNVIAGVFTFYLVATAWLTVMRKQKETGRLELGLLLLGLASGTGSLIFGWRVAHGATDPTAEIPPCPSLPLARWLCFLPPGTLACSFAAVFQAQNVSCGICGECALLCLLPQAPSSSEQPQIQSSGELACAPLCSPRQFARPISPRCRYSSSSY